MAKENLPEYFSRAEAERLFPGVVTASTLARLASQGRGPRFLKMGRRVFYRREDFVKWLEENSVEVRTIDQDEPR
ncbi:MAG TPA: DNA-binding protein [Chloroflexi bacterium]|nr:DNA-binding protein [Chloroflexota bacterium]